MKAEEIKLKSIKDAIVDLESSLEDEMQPYDETMKEALAALRKQVPMKITEDTTMMYLDGAINGVYSHCPMCNEYVFDLKAFCPTCGQRLDWRKYEK